jgi:hypothetical protein
LVILVGFGLAPVAFALPIGLVLGLVVVMVGSPIGIFRLLLLPLRPLLVDRCALFAPGVQRNRAPLAVQGGVIDRARPGQIASGQFGANLGLVVAQNPAVGPIDHYQISA